MKFDTFGKAGDYVEPTRPLNPLIYELRKLRYERGISQRALAQRMGYDMKTLQHAECGKSSPHLSFMFVWAEALGATIKLESVNEG